MNTLLILTGIIEVGAGLALLGFPPAAVALLLGSGLDTPAAVALARLAGVALLALGVACWLAHYDPRTRAARGVITAMTLYNFGAAVVLGVAGTQLHPAGIALWPAVLLHAALTVWCVTDLLAKPTQTTDDSSREP